MSGFLGRHHSPETRKRLSERMKGDKNPFKGHNFGLCKKCGKNHGLHPWIGRHHSPETRKRLSESLKGKMSGDRNPMKRPELRKWFSENNPMKRPEVSMRFRGKLDLTPSPALAYILGATLGDGCKTKYGLAIFTKDVEFARAYADALEKIGVKAWIGKSHKKSNILEVAASRIGLKEWFEKLDLRSIRELAQKFPADFIRGFYDAEGTLYRGTCWKLSMFNSNLDLLKLIQSLLQTHGFSSSLVEPKVRSETTIIEGRVVRRKKPCYVLYLLGQGRGKPNYLRREINRFIEFTRPSIQRKFLGIGYAEKSP